MQCNDEELRKLLYRSNNAEEHISTHNQNNNEGSVIHQVNIDSPATHDVTTLSLRDLIEIERKLDGDSPPEKQSTASHDFIRSSTNFIGSGGNDNSSPQFNIDDIICGNEFQDTEKTIDFDVDSDHKVTSYMDCMEPSSSKSLQSCSNMMEMNLMGPPAMSNLLNYTLAETRNTSTLPKTTSITENEGIFNFGTNESSATQTFNIAGIKRPLPGDSFSNFTSNINPPNKVMISENIEDSSSESDASVPHGDEVDDSFTDQKDDEFSGVTDRKEIRKLKNNKASRVHRAKKKKKHEELFDQKTDFEKRNAALRMQVESMEKEISFLKELLLVKVAATPNI